MNKNDSVLTVTLFQMDYRQGAEEENLARARAAAAEAASRGSDLLLLPELWYSGYDLSRAAELAVPLGEGQFQEAAGLARDHRLYLAGSMFCRDEAGRVVNRAVIHGPDGAVAGWYDKLHLFPKTGEHLHTAAGSRCPVFELPWGRTALAICYDLRFPELFRRYVLFQGAALVLVPSAWPEPRLRHLRTMSLARAGENQCFLAVCNRSGFTSRGRPAFGKSLVADPLGDPLVEAGRGEELLTTVLDFSLIERARDQLDLRRDFRRDIFYPDSGKAP